MGERNPFHRFERAINYSTCRRDAALRTGEQLRDLIGTVSYTQVARPNRLRSQAGQTEIPVEPLHQPPAIEDIGPTIYTVGEAPESTVAAALTNALFESGRVTIILHNDPDKTNL